MAGTSLLTLLLAAQFGSAPTIAAPSYASDAASAAAQQAAAAAVNGSSALIRAAQAAAPLRAKRALRPAAAVPR